jgi:hypothetical protein
MRPDSGGGAAWLYAVGSLGLIKMPVTVGEGVLPPHSTSGSDIPTIKNNNSCLSMSVIALILSLFNILTRARK